MITKKELTKIFLKNTGIEVKNDAELTAYIWKWWRNPVSKTSFRLTEEGHYFLSKTLQLQSYKLKLTTDIKASAKNFLLIDKHLSSPFYIENKNTIIFYGERDTLMVTLSGFNLQQYLESFENQ